MMLKSRDVSRRVAEIAESGRKRLPIVGVLLLLITGTARSDDGTGEWARASFEALLRDAQRYGTTEEKRARKRAAREEVFARKAASLRFFMRHLELENEWVRILADELIGQLSAEEAVPVLLDFVDADHADTRRLAVYFLGRFNTPEHADRILPLVEDEKAAGAAIRTLGKWRVEEAAQRIVPFLRDEKERRRIVAANALGDIGSEAGVAPLIEALGDPFFTVRRAAGLALVRIGKLAEEPLIRALGESEGVAKREIVRALGQMKSRRAARALRRLRKDPDPGVREEAVRALGM